MTTVDARQIQANLADIRARIRTAAERVDRDPAGICIVAVTKQVTGHEAGLLHAAGLRDFGENRLESAQEKIPGFASSARWHMIGHIQRRKARGVVELFDVVHSVDRQELAEALNRRCEPLGKTLPVFLEVNVSGEASKHGMKPSEVSDAAAFVRKHCACLELQGLMSMAPLVEDPEQARPVFSGLRKLARAENLPGLSMGMSNDFEVAVEEGATHLRIGTALFARKDEE